MSTATKIVLTVDRDGYTGGIQVSIGAEDDRGHGDGYRLFGPKYLGQSTKIADVVLTQRDADEIRGYLDQLFPVEVSA